LDYHLGSTNSPCIDKGVNVGFPYLDNAPDMGAYEWGFIARIRVLLEGAYVTNGWMSAALSRQGRIPLTSPYAADLRTVTAIPTNVTDWVLVFQQATNGDVVAAQSAFVNRDGYIVRETGATGIVVDISSGAACHVGVKHRNHLTVLSAEPILFTNLVVTYDFTTNADRYYGEPTGRWSWIKVSGG